MKRERHYLWMLLLLVGILFSFAGPTPALALDPGLYIADWGAGFVSYMDSQGNVTRFFPREGDATFDGPVQLAEDPDGNLIIAVKNEGKVIRVSPEQTMIEVVLEGLNLPHGIAFDKSGNLYVAEQGSGSIRKKPPVGESVVLVSGLGRLEDLEFDDFGNLYTTVYQDDGQLLRIPREALEAGPPIVPQLAYHGLDSPVGLEFYNGKIYVADRDNFRIVEVDPISLLADTYANVRGGIYSLGPVDIAFDELGNTYVSLYSEIGLVDSIGNFSTVATGFSLAEGLLYVPPEPEIIPEVIYVSNNPSNWIDKNEYIARIDMASPTATGMVTYFPATYNYYTNKDGWANPDGMAFVGNRLFITGFIPGTGNPNGIWEIDPNTGQELFYFPTPTGRLVALASDGTYLYASHYYGSRYTIFKYTTAGAPVASFRVPVLMNGLSYGEGYLFGVNNNVIYKMNAATGAMISKFVAPWKNVLGLDFVGGGRPYLLASVYLGSNVYRIDLNDNLDYAGTWSVFRGIPAGYNNSVAAAPVFDSVVPPASADDGVVPPEPADGAVPPATNVSGK